MASDSLCNSWMIKLISPIPSVSIVLNIKLPPIKVTLLREPITHHVILYGNPPIPIPGIIRLFRFNVGTQLVQHCGIAQSISQSTTKVCRGLGRRSHTFCGMAPSKLFPDRPIKPMRKKIVILLELTYRDEFNDI